MSDAREIIAQTIEPFVHHADDVTSVVISALDVAGFRIIGPDEVDPVTVEKCAQVAERAGKPAGASDGGTYVVGSATDAAATIRALASGESR